VLQLLGGHVKRIIPEADSKSVADILFGCAKMGWDPGMEILARMDERACVLKKGIKADTIANMLWSFATLGFRPKVMQLFGGLQRNRSQAVNFNANQVSHIIYAHAKLGVDPEHKFMGLLERDALQTMKSVAIFRDVVYFLWSYATLGMSPCRDMVKELERKALSFLDNMKAIKAEQMIDLLWSFATLRVSPRRKLMKAVEANAVSKGVGFPQQDVPRLIWAFETLGWQTSDALLMIGRGEVFRTPPPQLDSTYPHLHR